MSGCALCKPSALQHALQLAPLLRTSKRHVLSMKRRPPAAEQSQPLPIAQWKQRRLEGNHLRRGETQRTRLLEWIGPAVNQNMAQSGPGAFGKNDTVRRVQSITCRFFSGSAAKPGWVVSKQHQLGPALPDNAYYGEHATYSYFVLFTRGLRPYLEKILGDCWRTAKGAVLTLWRPVATMVVKQNPEFRLQLVAFASFLATHAIITRYFNGVYQRMVDVSSLLELQKAQRYATEGFWLSSSEQQDHRLQQHAEHYRELVHVWQEALREATLSRNFDVLIRSLAKPETLQHEVRHSTTQAAAETRHDYSSRQCGIPPPLLWNFNALPYGKNDPHTRTFPIPSYEQPLRAFALSFTANNLSGNWGDYVDRQDNKNALMRPARMMFTDVLIPPTK